jgi:hypothetical protein
MIPRSRTSSQRPFVTRGTTIGFAALFTLSNLVAYFLPASLSGGLYGVAISLLGAVILVSLVVAWVLGGVLAWRSRSLLWLLVACLPPPFGAVPCALFAPAAPGAGPPQPGIRRR